MQEKEETIFGRIIRKEVDSEMVYEDDEVVAFKDINPQAPVHILIVPRKEIPKLTDAEDSDADLLGRMMIIAKKLAKQFKLDEEGFRILINQGKLGGQTIYHLHLHLMGGRRFMWPPG